MTTPAARRAALAHGEIAWLEAGDAAAPPLVLLHGIGACAASWTAQLESLSARFRVLAWDAPGYGDSAPLPTAQPLAADYAAAAAKWLQAASVQRPVVLGHSLGALIGSALAARTAVQALLLASPAQGYGNSDTPTRQKKFEERVTALRELGIEGMAAQRSSRLCAPGAAPEAIDQVRRNMLRITLQGYPAAAWMLANDAIGRYLADLQAPAAVLCGALDGVTPPQPARELAQRIGAPFTELPGLGHACYIENPAAFDAAVLAALDTIGATRG